MSIHSTLYPFLAGILLAITLAACTPTPLTPVPVDPTAQPAAPSKPAPPAASPPSPPPPTPTSPSPPSRMCLEAVPAQPANPFAPQPGDEKLQRGSIYLDSTHLLVMESYPPQYRLALAGSLPTPCHQLRIQLHEPDTAGKIEVDVYSLTDPDRMCMQVLQPFDAAIPLQYPAGKYSLWVNGQQAGTLDVPG